MSKGSPLLRILNLYRSQPALLSFLFWFRVLVDRVERSGLTGFGRREPSAELQIGI